MDRSCSESGLTVGCKPKYRARIRLTCVEANTRPVLRIVMNKSRRVPCGADGESLGRSTIWEAADPACRDQRTRRSTGNSALALSGNAVTPARAEFRSTLWWAAGPSSHDKI